MFCCTPSASPSYPFRSPSARDEYLAYYDAQAEACWPTSSETRLVDTSYGETFVRISPPTANDAPPLILLPGDGETSLAWALVVESLSAKYRTYCVDHINDVGRSVSHPTQTVERPSDFVVWLDEMISALSFAEERIYLVGHSYGGWIASLYALAHPERLSKLVLLSPCATVLPAPPSLLIRAIMYGVLPFRSYMRWYMYWYACDSVKENATTKKYVDDMIEEQILARQCFVHRTFVIPTVLSDDEWRSLSVPTLYLVGENDVSYNAKDAVRRLGRIAPGIECRVAEAPADHHMALVRPRWTCEHVLGFLGH